MEQFHCLFGGSCVEHRKNESFWMFIGRAGVLIFLFPKVVLR